VLLLRCLQKGVVEEGNGVKRNLTERSPGYATGLVQEGFVRSVPERHDWNEKNRDESGPAGGALLKDAVQSGSRSSKGRGKCGKVGKR